MLNKIRLATFGRFTSNERVAGFIAKMWDINLRSGVIRNQRQNITLPHRL